MRTEPKTDKEILEANLMPDGVYPFEVVAANDAVSKSGNEMIVLKLRIVDQQNVAHVLTDYLLASMAFKLKHFAYYHGMSEKYEADNLLAQDCFGVTGFVEITSDKEPKPKGDGTFYPLKSFVKDYVDNGGIKPKIVNQADPLPATFNDDVPW